MKRDIPYSETYIFTLKCPGTRNLHANFHDFQILDLHLHLIHLHALPNGHDTSHFKILDRSRQQKTITQEDSIHIQDAANQSIHTFHTQFFLAKSQIRHYQNRTFHQRKWLLCVSALIGSHSHVITST